MQNVAIIDSGGANIASLQFALARLGANAAITGDAEEIRGADRVVLPGVGAARNAMQRLQQLELVDTIRELQQPLLGICLGLQLLCEASAEEDVRCLGVFAGTAAKLPATPDLPVPNMGWCPIESTGKHPVLAGIDDGEYFYFVHSYAVPVGDETIASAVHADAFSAVLARDNFVAAQFHPERSSAAGATLLQNFLDWTP